MCGHLFIFHFLKKIYLFIYLAVPGLSCSTQDHGIFVGIFIAAYGIFLVAACGLF